MANTCFASVFLTYSSTICNYLHTLVSRGEVVYYSYVSVVVLPHVVIDTPSSMCYFLLSDIG